MRWVHFGLEDASPDGEYIHTHDSHNPITLSEMQIPEMHGNHNQQEGKKTATAVAYKRRGQLRMGGVRWMRFVKENVPPEGAHIYTHAPHSPAPLNEMQLPEMHGSHVQQAGETTNAVAHERRNQPRV